MSVEKNSENGLGNKLFEALKGLEQLDVKPHLVHGYYTEDLRSNPYTPLKHAIRAKVLCYLGKRAGLSWAGTSTIEQLMKKNPLFEYALSLSGYCSVTIEPDFCLSQEENERFSAWGSESIRQQCKVEYDALAPKSVRKLFDDPDALAQYAEQLAYLSSCFSRKRAFRFETAPDEMKKMFPLIKFEEFVEVSSFLLYLDKEGSEDSFLYRVANRRDTNILTLLAILNKVSAFAEGKTVNERMAEWILSYPEFSQDRSKSLFEIADRPFDDVARLFLLSGDSEDDVHPASNFLLFAAVEGHILDEQLKQAVLKRLFLHYMTPEGLRYFVAHDIDENYLYIKGYTQKRFAESFAEGTPFFYYAAAAIKIRESQDRDENCAVQAMEDILSQDEAVAYLGIIELGLTAWSRKYAFVKTPEFSVNEQVADRIVLAAFSPHSPLHRAGYAAISDLLREEYLPKTVLAKPAVVEKAVAMLNGSDTDESEAADMLCDCSINQMLCPIVGEGDNLRDKYIQKYEDAAAADKIRLFPFCAALGCWAPSEDGIGAKMKQLDANVREIPDFDYFLKNRLMRLRREVAELLESVSPS